MTRHKLSAGATVELLTTLEARFAAHPERHVGIEWPEVVTRLHAGGARLGALAGMERTGGEPDVVAQAPETGEFIFYDCSSESPQGCRNVCYDPAAQASRTDGLARASAMEMAAELGIELPTEAEYRHLQTLGRFDAKTTSWLFTPPEIRRRGGAIFGQLGFAHVFVCPNGAQSFYGSRGFRGSLRL